MSILNDTIKRIRKIKRDTEKGEYKSNLSYEDLLRYINEPHIMYSRCEDKKYMIDHIEEFHPALRDIIKHHYALCMNGNGYCKTGGGGLMELLEFLAE